MSKDFHFRRIVPRRKSARSLLWFIGLFLAVLASILYLKSIAIGE